MRQGRSGMDRKRFSFMDMAERAFLLLLLGWFLARLVPSLDAEPYNFLMLVSEVFTVGLVMFRKPGPMATTAYAWIVAVAGTCAPLLASITGAAVIPAWLGAILMFWGLLFSLSAKMFLNRSFGIVAANRGVKRSGPYKLVRHPMYLGYFVTHVGFLLLHFSGWNAAIYAAGWLALILRIRNEEEFLSRDERYRDYAGSVRYRLIPGLY